MSSQTFCHGCYSQAQSRQMLHNSALQSKRVCLLETANYLERNLEPQRHDSNSKLTHQADEVVLSPSGSTHTQLSLEPRRLDSKLKSLEPRGLGLYE